MAKMKPKLPNLIQALLQLVASPMTAMLRIVMFTVRTHLKTIYILTVHIVNNKLVHLINWVTLATNRQKNDAKGTDATSSTAPERSGRVRRAAGW